MSTKDKLIERFKSMPKDFTFDELKKLLAGFGFEMNNKGKTSGSRVCFRHDVHEPIIIHKPHTAGKPIDSGALKDVYVKLIEFNLIKK